MGLSTLIYSFGKISSSRDSGPWCLLAQGAAFFSGNKQEGDGLNRDSFVPHPSPNMQSPSASLGFAQLWPRVWVWALPHISLFALLTLLFLPFHTLFYFTEQASCTGLSGFLITRALRDKCAPWMFRLGLPLGGLIPCVICNCHLYTYTKLVSCATCPGW